MDSSDLLNPPDIPRAFQTDSLSCVAEDASTLAAQHGYHHTPPCKHEQTTHAQSQLRQMQDSHRVDPSDAQSLQPLRSAVDQLTQDPYAFAQRELHDARPPEPYASFLVCYARWIPQQIRSIARLTRNSSPPNFQQNPPNTPRPPSSPRRRAAIFATSPPFSTRLTSTHGERSYSTSTRQSSSARSSMSRRSLLRSTTLV